jgi:hypothetical protein
MVKMKTEADSRRLALFGLFLVSAPFIAPLIICDINNYRTKPIRKPSSRGRKGSHRLSRFTGKCKTIYCALYLRRRPTSYFAELESGIP